MVSFRFKIVPIIILVLLSVLVVAPALAMDYLPGLTKGQFVQYGHFVGVGQDFQAYNDNDWMNYKVAEVNQTIVSLVLTGQFKNGTVFLGNGDTWVYDIRYSSLVNGTQIIGENPIIAGGLQKYAPLSPNSFDYQFVNDTQTKTYIGVSRQINILNFTTTKDGVTNTLTYFYDQASGMLLEMRGETESETETQQFSYIVVETNIFETQQGIPLDIIYVAVASVAIALAIITAVLVMKKTTGKNRSKNRKRRFL